MAVGPNADGSASARVVPELDPGFQPLVLSYRRFQSAASACGRPARLEIAVERSPSSITRHSMLLFPEEMEAARDNFRQAERTIKFLLWAKGGWRVLISGPEIIARQLTSHYRESSTGRFDAALMGESIYGRSFEVLHVPPEKLPAATETSRSLGRQWNGCRIGFDLGASDIKVAAVKEGAVLFSEEFRWDPRPQGDPQWHFDQIQAALRSAAAHLPRVDAIGGSSAGVIVNNQVRVASLFRGVPEALFHSRVRGLFGELRKAWNNIPFEVVNDGEVTALAGAMSLGAPAVLGIAMGSSLAAGYADRAGNITPWLNELAFAPVDARHDGPLDEWSSDRGCGVQFFSQQAVARLIPASGLEISQALPLPDRLLEVQASMRKGDERAARIYRTIGAYLACAAAQYRDYYDFDHLLLLGRVTTGEGGSLLLGHAKQLLQTVFPETKIQLHMPDEKEKRHGQAMAAASLPVVH